MSGFSLQWLDLREPLDAASRAAGIAEGLIVELTRGRSPSTPLAIVDLGAGTGANLRYAAPLLGGPQDWLLVERDPALQGGVDSRMRVWRDARPISAQGAPLALQGARFECRIGHLALDLATQLPELPLATRGLLTASALLDLVSEEWLRSLAARAAEAGASVWFALTYDGRIECLPAEPEDSEVRDLFNRHQRQDKGFGLALGPAAAQTTEQVFAQHGYRVRCAPSPWRIGPEQLSLQHALVDGWFGAACEMAPHRIAALRGWRTRRRAHINSAGSELRVGHVDLIGHPSA